MEDDACAPSVAPTLRAADGTALYVHLPYCVALCTYCDFFSVVAGDTSRDVDGTVTAILREAQRRGPTAPRTVFFGGGTPSLLSIDELTRLLDGLDEHTGFRASAQEVTLECNPESLDLHKARALRELGVDRLSIGFQSLDPSLLATFGRVHSVDDSFAAFRAARDAGFERVSVDLIYGVPGQTLDEWERDLARVLELGPDHVSAYSLAFEDGTPLTLAVERGDLERLDEDTELAFFERTRAQLIAAGFEPYEISNFATTDQRCRHNEGYWRNAPYVGLGPGAVSKVGDVRFGNPRSVGEWKRATLADGFAATWEEQPDAAERIGETWWLGLRTLDGVDPSHARAVAGIEETPGEPDSAEREARTLEDQGLLEHVAGRWRLTPRGLPLADAVARRFLNLDAFRFPARDAAPGR